MKPELKEWDRAMTEYLTADPNDPRSRELLVKAIEEHAKAAGLLVKPLAVSK
jgi:hypothetical protein